MRLLRIFLGLYFLACVGTVYAQTSLEDAGAVSSLISPHTVLKDVVVAESIPTDSAESTAQPTDPNLITGEVVAEPTTLFIGASWGWKKKHIGFNAADSSIKGKFIYEKEGLSWKVGFELGGKAVNGYTSLFDGKNVSPDAHVDFFAIRSFIPKKNIDTPKKNNGGNTDSTPENVGDNADSLPFLRGQWLAIRGGYRRGEYKLIDSKSSSEMKNAPLNNSEHTAFHGLSLFVRYNALLPGSVLCLPGRLFTGISIGGARQSNYSELDQVEITNTQTSVLKDDETSRVMNQDDETLQVTNQVTNQVTKMNFMARKGDSEKDYEVFPTMSCNADLLWIPNFPDKKTSNEEDAGEEASNSDEKTSDQTVGVGVFGRYTYRCGEIKYVERDTLQVGMGIFFFENLDKKADSEETTPQKAFLSKITGGLTVQYDIYEGDVKFGLVTGYNF